MNDVTTKLLRFAAGPVVLLDLDEVTVTSAFPIADGSGLEKWPAGVRKALLRFEMTGNNTVGVQNFRVHADYRDPLASKIASPFRVVHRWKEDGREQTHAETISRLPARYTIRSGADPEMVSVSYEMAASR